MHLFTLQCTHSHTYGRRFSSTLEVSVGVSVSRCGALVHSYIVAHRSLLLEILFSEMRQVVFKSAQEAAHILFVFEFLHALTQSSVLVSTTVPTVIRRAAVEHVMFVFLYQAHSVQENASPLFDMGRTESICQQR